MALCEIGGWCRCCFGGPGDGQVCLCEIDGVSLSGVYAGVIVFFVGGTQLCVCAVC